MPTDTAGTIAPPSGPPGAPPARGTSWVSRHKYAVAGIGIAVLAGVIYLYERNKNNQAAAAAAAATPASPTPVTGTYTGSTDVPGYGSGDVAAQIAALEQQIASTQTAANASTSTTASPSTALFSQEKKQGAGYWIPNSSQPIVASNPPGHTFQWAGGNAGALPANAKYLQVTPGYFEAVSQIPPGTNLKGSAFYVELN